MAEQLNNLQLLDGSGTLRGIDKNNDTLKITVPFTVGADMSVGGDLTVEGDVISRGSVNVVSKDPVIDLGLGDFTGTAQTGGFTVQTNKAAGFTALTVTAFQSKADASGDANFTVADASTLSVGMVVAITGAADGENDGYYVVKSKAGGVVSVEAAFMGALPFAQTDFKTATGQAAKVYNVDLSAVVVTDGTLVKTDTPSTVYWPIGSLVNAYITAATKTKFEAPGAYQGTSDVSLQEAYVAGNTITTSAGNGDVTVAGTEKLAVSASGGVQISGGALDVNTSVDVDLTGSFAVDGAQAVSFGSSTAVSSFAATTAANGDIALTAGAKLDFSASGAIEFDAAADSYIKATAKNLTVEASGAGILDLKSGTEVQASTVLFDVNASGAVQIDAAAASNLTVAGADLVLSTTSSGKVEVTSAGLMDVNAGASLDIDVTGSYDMLSTTTFSIDGTGNSNVSATSGSLTVSTITTGDLVLTAADNVNMDGGLIEIDATKAVSIAAAQASDFTVAGANLLLTTTSSGDVQVTAAQKFDVSSGGATEIDAAASSYVKVTGGDLTLETATSGKIYAKSAGLTQIDAGSSLDVNVTGNVTCDASGTLHFAGTGNSDFEVTSGNLSITTKTSGNVTLDAIAGTLTMAGNGAVTLDSDTAGVSIGAADNSDFTVVGSGKALTLEVSGGGLGQQIYLKSAGANLDAIKLETTDSAGGINVSAKDKLALSGKFIEATASDTSFLKQIANAAGDKTLTIGSQNSGAGKGLLDIFADETITVKSSNDAVIVARANGNGNILDVQYNQASKLQVTNAETLNFQAVRFEKSAGTKLTANTSANVAAGTVCAFDSTGKMISANAVAGGNTPSAQDEVTRVPFAAAIIQVNANTFATFQTIPGTPVALTFDAAPNGLVGQAVYLGAGANAGKATLTAPTTSNASIWRLGWLAGNAADGAGNYPVYWDTQYIGRRPVA